MLSVGRSGDDEVVVFERPARRRGKGFGRGGQVATVMRHRFPLDTRLAAPLQLGFSFHGFWAQVDFLLRLRICSFSLGFSFVNGFGPFIINIKNIGGKKKTMLLTKIL